CRHEDGLLLSELLEPAAALLDQVLRLVKALLTPLLALGIQVGCLLLALGQHVTGLLTAPGHHVGCLALTPGQHSFCVVCAIGRRASHRISHASSRVAHGGRGRLRRRRSLLDETAHGTADLLVAGQQQQKAGADHHGGERVSHDAVHGGTGHRRTAVPGEGHSPFGDRCRGHALLQLLQSRGKTCPRDIGFFLQTSARSHDSFSFTSRVSRCRSWIVRSGASVSPLICLRPVSMKATPITIAAPATSKVASAGDRPASTSPSTAACSSSNSAPAMKMAPLTIRDRPAFTWLNFSSSSALKTRTSSWIKSVARLTVSLKA